MPSGPKQKQVQSQLRPSSSILTLEELRSDADFREFWGEVLKGIRTYGMNEAILSYLHAGKVRKGNIDAINAQAALDMHRLEGGLEIWEVLLRLLDEKAPLLEAPQGDEDDQTETL